MALLGDIFHQGRAVDMSFSGFIVEKLSTDMAANGAVSARKMRAPKLVGEKPASIAACISVALNPPSGPLRHSSLDKAG